MANRGCSHGPLPCVRMGIVSAILGQQLHWGDALDMPSNFDLIITADYPSRTAEFRLRDAHGSQIAFRSTDFKHIDVSRQQGLFDLRNYLHNYVVAGKEEASVAEVGVCIAEEVLGITIDNDEVRPFRTVDDVRGFIIAKVQAAREREMPRAPAGSR